MGAYAVICGLGDVLGGRVWRAGYASAADLCKLGAFAHRAVSRVEGTEKTLGFKEITWL